MTDVITSAEQLRTITCSYYMNNDFDRVGLLCRQVQREVAAVIGTATMEWLSTEGRDTDAFVACATAIGYMATMRYTRLNDLSHEDEGRKVKIDRDNEARPFEWQLARDERAHLDEYYRALDSLLRLLWDVEEFRQSATWQRMQGLIVADSTTLAYLTGVQDSPWLYMQLVPHLAETQHHVSQAYGDEFRADDFCTFESTDTVEYAAQKAVALGALALMGRRTRLQAMPYGLVELAMADGGGNRQEPPTAEALDDYLRELSRQQHYWLNEMRTLRDRAAGQADSHLQMPENDQRNKYMRV